MPRCSIWRVIASIFSARPGALRASSSVAGGGAIRGLDSTVWTVPPNTGAASLVISLATVVLLSRAPFGRLRITGDCANWYSVRRLVHVYKLVQASGRRLIPVT